MMSGTPPTPGTQSEPIKAERAVKAAQDAARNAERSRAARPSTLILDHHQKDRAKPHPSPSPKERAKERLHALMTNAALAGRPSRLTTIVMIGTQAPHPPAATAESMAAAEDGECLFAKRVPGILNMSEPQFLL